MAASSPSSVLSPSRVTVAHPHLHLPSSTDPPSESNPPTQKVWIVFGATGHIGRSLVKAALSHGDNVAAVGRTLENTMPQMQGWHEQCLGLLCDVRVRSTVKTAMESCISRFGRIDIIVNCTGYGVIGACEDQDTSDLRSQFDTNFLGTLNIIQLSLPYFRHQSAKRRDGENAGRYLIFSSTSGALGVPGLGPYCATKYAVEGLIESMLYEVDTFGIKATLVEPGHMRLDEPTGLDDKATDDNVASAAGHTMVKLQRYGHFFVKKPSAPYDTPTAPAGHAGRVVQWLADRQPTSAVKSAELVWQLGHCKYPPLRLLLGSFAIESVRDRLRSIIEEIEDWKHLHFPSPEGEGGKGKGKGEDDDMKMEGDAEGELDGEDDGMYGAEAEVGAEVKEEDDG
ncbi:1,2-dihydroxy-3-keto-5-methylthiopentene dioxygenase [Elasticomyces elasticus]|uniref:1,2-dihydroxy-3-keto-5-methylthiopentene dioxygenase n=1 Tax=Elasticomyces elasticus TaxID=574655 RepID=A0AAN8A594_9PEZI|nr:1,2-dihydroxy-3-keto-5-methylthiopentene dioxygenase [Elasticomyces elasticus]KAK4974970.1 1,2-dihydroxy-3-keto-5-methylthiopentene dioxygenase [Elasticomyces elasticus]KAK5706826.1 1,2-dihydroxy-3-keto-5-methylthiopentene dioxygenase [Elasticomyces elasticus]KAK5713173.1 1,2-dihydroxy-3-keto-5-methylthiopentene dioxygenase [Elasticomyces elasticus]